ncbi:MAG: chemotaxis protein CheW [Acidobacteriota bacterium]
MKTSKDKKAAVVEDTVQIVTFRVGAEEYGLDIGAITEVIRPLKITPLPRMPQFIEGVINLRGAIIPVIDLRKRFALEKIVDNPRTMRMVITRGAVAGGPGPDKGLLGLLVDSVHEVLHLRKQDIEPAPQAATGEFADFITGMGKAGERLIILLDIPKVLSQQERAALEKAEHGEP